MKDEGNKKNTFLLEGISQTNIGWMLKLSFFIFLLNSKEYLAKEVDLDPAVTKLRLSLQRYPNSLV